MECKVFAKIFLKMSKISTVSADSMKKRNEDSKIRAIQMRSEVVMPQKSKTPWAASKGRTEAKVVDLRAAYTSNQKKENRLKETLISNIENSRSLEMNTLIGQLVKLELRKPRSVKTMAFISNKGGVGKTHISSNMAFYINRMGKQSLLIDLDLGNSDVTSKLGFFCENTIMDLLVGKIGSRELIYTTPYGFYLIPGESGNLRLANLNVPQKKRLIRLLKEVSTEYDYVLYDLSAGISKTNLDFALAQDYQIVVATPQDIVAGYGCIKAAFQRFQEVEKDMAKRDSSYKPRTTFQPFVIINQVTSYSGGKELFNKLVTVAKHNITCDKGFNLDIKLLGVVGADPEYVRQAEMEHYLYSGKHGASHTGQCFHFLAHNLIQYRDPYSMEFTTKLRRFANLLMKSVEEVKYAQ